MSTLQSICLVEIKNALLGRDRVLISALLSQATFSLIHGSNEIVEGKGKQRERAQPLVVQLGEADCSNTTSALRALVTGFLTKFEDKDTEVCRSQFDHSITHKFPLVGRLVLKKVWPQLWPRLTSQGLLRRMTTAIHLKVRYS